MKCYGLLLYRDMTVGFHSKRYQRSNFYWSLTMHGKVCPAKRLTASAEGEKLEGGDPS